MNKYIRNIGYKVPFEFCKECKAFSPYEMRKTCLKDDGCKEAVRLYKKHTEWKTATTVGEHNINEWSARNEGLAEN